MSALLFLSASIVIITCGNIFIKWDYASFSHLLLFKSSIFRLNDFKWTIENPHFTVEKSSGLFNLRSLCPPLCLLGYIQWLHMSPQALLFLLDWFHLDIIRSSVFQLVFDQVFLRVHIPFILILSILEPSLNHLPCVWLLCVAWIEDFLFSLSLKCLLQF